MGRIGLSFEDVSSAANEIIGQGQSPTVDRIREVLGTGSKTTIAKYLKDWRTQNTDTSSITIPQDLLSLVKGLWEHIQEQASKRISEANEEAKNKVAAICEKHTQLQNEFIIKKNAIEELEKNLHDKDNTLQTTIKNLQLKQQECTQTAERLEAAKNLHEKELMANQQLHLHLDNMQKNLQHYQNAIQQQNEQQALDVENQRQRYEQTILQLQIEMKDAQHSQQHLQIELKKSESENNLTRNNLSNLQQDYQKLLCIAEERSNKIASLTTMKDIFSMEIKQLTLDKNDNHSKILELEKNITRTVNMLENANAEIKKQKSEIANLQLATVHK